MKFYRLLEVHRNKGLGPSYCFLAGEQLGIQGYDLSLSEDLAITPLTFAEDESSEEFFFEFNHDFSKDTIPSEEKIEIVLEMVQALSDEERKELANQFIQMPEWVNVFFNAIATRLAKAEE